jgi:hypothetical protein
MFSSMRDGLPCYHGSVDFLVPVVVKMLPFRASFNLQAKKPLRIKNHHCDRKGGAPGVQRLENVKFSFSDSFTGRVLM